MNAAESSNEIKFEPLREIKPPRQVCAARYSPCGQFLLAGGYDGSVRRWRVAADEVEELSPFSRHDGWVDGVALHRESDLCFTADSWGAIVAWRYSAEAPAIEWEKPQSHTSWIRDLALSPDDELLASCGRDGLVRVWSAATGALHQQLRGHDEDVYSVAFHPHDPAEIVSGDLKGRIRHWNANTGKCQRTLDASTLYAYLQIQNVGGIRRLAFDDSGARLACVGTRPNAGANVQGAPTVLLFDWPSGELVKAIEVGKPSDGYVFDICWHRDGYWIAATSGNPGSGKLLCVRESDDKPFAEYTKMANCHSLSLHPDGTSVVVAATNTGSAGNGRPLKDGKYVGNFSPIHFLKIEPAQKS